MADMPASSCTIPPSNGLAAPEEPFWLENIKHQGKAAFNPDPNAYQVFRNVKDFGAKGDGVTDDTAAINEAMSSGGRCGGGNCGSSTIVPAIVYFPRGIYLVSASINAYYYTQITGDAKNPPTLLAAPNFQGMAVIDADPYIPGGWGAQWYTNQNNFFRSVRNLVIDLRQMPPSASATGLHWQVAQATSLINIVVEMSTQSGNNHQGIFMENGSGGFMGDLVFNGGKYGIWVGNQQFTVRNLTINNAATAIYSGWNWGWTFQRLNINNCQVGFDLATGGTTSATQTVGAEAIIDAVVTNTPIFIRTSTSSKRKLAGSLVLNNIKLHDVPIAVGVVGGEVVLKGGSRTIHSWAQGNIYEGTKKKARYVRDDIPPPNKPASLLDCEGRIFGRTHPQYADYSVSQFVSVKDHGAKGDGLSDDTEFLNEVMRRFAGHKIIFFPHGTYILTSTLKIPAGAQIVGEAWSVISGRGQAFQDQNQPRPVVQVGEKHSEGIVEITDIIFSTVGPAGGAIVVEWNVREPGGVRGALGCGILISGQLIPPKVIIASDNLRHLFARLGGASGTNLELENCPAGTDSSLCMAAFLALHLTKGSTAYLEGTWVWLADHDLDGDSVSQISIFGGRGILSESEGPVWMIGTAEHFVLYQYSLVRARNHYMGLIQTETPYFQPVPPPPFPFNEDKTYRDPFFPKSISSAWGLWVESSHDIIIFGAGLYSFFNDYQQACLSDSSCQKHTVHVDEKSTIHIFSLSTVGTTFQVSVNGEGIVNHKENVNGFASTATLWRSRW